MSTSLSQLKVVAVLITNHISLSNKSDMNDFLTILTRISFEELRDTQSKKDINNGTLNCIMGLIE